MHINDFHLSNPLLIMILPDFFIFHKIFFFIFSVITSPGNTYSKPDAVNSGIFFTGKELFRRSMINKVCFAPMIWRHFAASERSCCRSHRSIEKHNQAAVPLTWPFLLHRRCHRKDRSLVHPSLTQNPSEVTRMVSIIGRNGLNGHFAKVHG